ncbi:Planctomycete cytochrome C [Maioricimonas rarisocia]|uniref:Planctomycete cytochrome C n=1 Tax=Maioricimonas rarisocia TaxID=2528026 RepID=A0A517Z812_9PLAN|nr:PSD1 and planctomycete cytochrome C domain-containing protein [Maioricimonas rarisocia]QDU38618.1 Planctomycete cytochrome C [Maioricimonas rarisocia]
MTLKSLCTFLLMTLAVSRAESADVAATIDYVRDVRPILQKHCYECHGEDDQSSSLRLDIRSEALKGGDLYGASIVPGKAAESPLIQFVSDEDADLQMPPDGEELSADEIAILTRWVNAGAEWPKGVDLATLEERPPHWSFQPVSDADPPTPKDAAWCRNPIDRFVLARLETEGLQPAHEADRRTWLRRVSFDLTGLPPTPEEITAFENDDRPDAYKRVVERLLQSPAYGERWAQHWLDVVRFADTHGFEVNTERPHAWPYRDYVIEAFNSDTPYDQFIREQIVGDALGEDEATGFLVTASVLLPGQIGKDAPSMRLARQDAIDEIVVNISQSFLGLSVGCARCHSHKFDPISQRDYYAMQAFVAGVEYGDRPIRDPEAEAAAGEIRAELGDTIRELAEFVPPTDSGATRPPLNARLNYERFAPVTTQKIRFTILTTNKYEPCLDELEVFNLDGRNVALASAGTTPTASGSKTSTNRHELRFVNDGQYGNSRSWMCAEREGGWVELTFAEPQTVDLITWGRDREGKFDDRLAIEYRLDVADQDGNWTTVADSTSRAAFDQQMKAPPINLDQLNEDDRSRADQLLGQQWDLQEKLKAFPDGGRLVFAGTFREPDVIRLLRRGDPEQPQDVVAPAVLSQLGTLTLPADTPEQQRRRALADWIASPDNPLTARVMVNRIWQGHFGIGLVETANDFGRNGVAPTHPELLDWLAAEFIRSGWSVKQMHRLIVLSSTYCQSTQHNPAAAARDADVRLLWRFPSRRLEGEAIRDTILFVSGRLSRESGGPGYDLFDKRGGLTGFNPVESFSGKGLRRMIYAHRVRRERDAVFGAFDCPDYGQSTPRRRESTTPLQALNLFNSRFVLEQTAVMAERVEAEARSAEAAQIERAYELALGRRPDESELVDAAPVVAEYGLAALCRALINSNEFLFLP